jgi:hypothetical protein
VLLNTPAALEMPVHLSLTNPGRLQYMIWRVLHRTSLLKRSCQSFVLDAFPCRRGHSQPSTYTQPRSFHA